MSSPALLLDIGGVVLRSAHEMMGLLARRRPELAGFAARRGRLGPEPDPAWEDALAGRLAERAYWGARASEAAETIGGAGDAPALMDLLYADGLDVFRPEAVALMTDAAADGRTVAALTNDLAVFHGHTDLSRAAVLQRFDVIVDGSVTGVLKPDPRAYELALAELDRPAGDVVFLDDMPPNVTAARAAGLRTVEVDVTAPAAAFVAARALLGLHREAA